MNGAAETNRIPVIDVTPLVNGQANSSEVASAIGRACRQSGFLYIVGHGIEEDLRRRLEITSRDFFAQELETKLKIRMELGGRAWRGYFPVGNELTSGKPDQKEGIYFGAELGDDHAKVKARVPLHGRNLFPDLPGFRETVLEYLDRMTELAHSLMRGIAISLELEPDFFRAELTADPTVLFRIFHYPALFESNDESLWSVGEHTDYGLLTILLQDEAGGLQVKSLGEWIDAPPIPDSFVCNIGDMLDRMSGGLYRSTPHRVRNRGKRSRCSFPFFFDPGFDADIKPILQSRISEEPNSKRWDGANLDDLRGTYGEYLMRKVSKVFPDLSQENL